MTRKCANPSCDKPFTPRPNVPNQKVCTGSYREKCGKKCPGATCRKCGGKGTYTRTCKDWYKGAWGRMKTVPRAIPPEDWAKIARALPKAPAWLRLVAVLGRESGMRISEIIGLTVGDVTTRGKMKGSIDVRGQWKKEKGKKGKLAPTKTGMVREGFLTPTAGAAIEAYMREEGRRWEPEDRLLPYTRQFIWQGWVAFQEKIGVHPPEADHYRVHDLRHTCATMLAAAGRIDLAKDFLGHSSAATTQRYNNPRPEKKLADAAAIFGGKK